MVEKEQQELIKLNLGSGDKPLNGYTNIDRRTGQEAYPLECEDNSVDEIRASHILEHFGHHEVSEVVGHWADKLKPGGTMKIAVPDAMKICKAYISGQPINVQGYMMGGQVDDNDQHKTMFDHETLRMIMNHAGLVRIGFFESDAEDCTRLPISLNMIGYKPTIKDLTIEGVAAVLASARFGPITHHKCANESLAKLGIPYHVYTGCFWHKLLSEGMEKLIAEDDIQYIITGDYDSVFTLQDVAEMISLIKANPDVDAICPVQAKRGSSGQALFTIADENWKVLPMSSAMFDRQMTQISTGHFGLTIFRADALRKLPKPWMSTTPDKDGRWSNESMDFDIGFWKGWREAGFNLYLANRVIIGHMQEAIFWPGSPWDSYKPIFQAFEDYNLNGIPKGVRYFEPAIQHVQV